MKPLDDIKLNEIVAQQEAEAAKSKRERIGKLVAEKINQRERIKERMLALQDELDNVAATIGALREGDWSEIDWKPDSSEM